jgi:hypothetical protein
MTSWARGRWPAAIAAGRRRDGSGQSRATAGAGRAAAGSSAGRPGRDARSGGWCSRSAKGTAAAGTGLGGHLGAAAATVGAGSAAQSADRLLFGTAARPRCLLPALVRQRASTGGPAAHLPDGFGDACAEDTSTDWCERFVFLNIEGIAGTWPRGAPPESCRMELAGRRRRGPQLRITTTINRRPELAEHSVTGDASTRARLHSALGRTRLLQVTCVHASPSAQPHVQGAEQIE